ncbi:MAG: ABC transporter ATP-binding protein [bacterium]|nr:ABC transporter ATP-binding protein [bacterium]
MGDSAEQTSPVPDRPSPLLVQVRALRVSYPLRGGLLRKAKGEVPAVDGVSFDIPAGQSFGLVGESGCGKTTLGRALLRLGPRSAGEVRIGGEDVYGLDRGGLRRLRRQTQIVLQDPYSSLNPRMTVESIVGEPLVVHRAVARKRRRARIAEILARVGLGAGYLPRYPAELSGGQRQRVSIARAIALTPRFIVCDECVSALDVSVKAQVLNLLRDLQTDLGLTYLFISHDLSVVRHLCSRMAVMHRGRIVEQGLRDDILSNPAHPHTRSLLAAVPCIGPSDREGSRRYRTASDSPTPGEVHD